MKKHYDFSKGEKGKFYIPENEIEIPVYLNYSNREYYMKIASEKNIDLPELINNILTKGKDLINIIVTK